MLSFRYLRAAWAVLALTAGLLVSGTALAQVQLRGKPGGGGGSVPPGTLYYSYNGDIWGMKADGSDKYLALSGNGVNNPNLYAFSPSNRLYGAGNRWWLGLRYMTGVINPNNNNTQTELSAYRFDATAPNGVRQVQITNLGSDFWPDSESPQWSNDGQDGFVSFLAYDYRRYKLSGNLADIDETLFRISISAAEIEAAANANVDPLLDVTALQPIESVSSTDFMVYHHWSPDGNQVAYLLRVGSTNNGALYVRDVTSAQTRKLRDMSLSGSHPFRWSPDGSKILVSDGSLWTINPGTGALLQTILAGDSKNVNTRALWSPAGDQVSFTRRTLKSFAYTYSISRLPAAGGTVTALTSDLSADANKINNGWVSDDLAP